MSSAEARLRGTALTLLLVSLAACVQAPGPARPPPAGPAAPAAQPAGVWAVDARASSLRILVRRAGRLAALGHNHVLGLPPTQGGLHLTSQRLDLSFRLDELEFDRPDWRAALGPDFASVPDAEAIAATRRNMLIALEAQRYPLVRLQAEGLVGDMLPLDISLHGQTRRVTVPLQLELRAGSLRVQARFAIRQSDFGIQPFTVLGGLLAVQDELTVEADLTLGREAR